MNATVMNSVNSEIKASEVVNAKSVMSDNVMFFVKMSVLMAGAIVFMASSFISL